MKTNCQHKNIFIDVYSKGVKKSKKMIIKICADCGKIISDIPIKHLNN